MANPLMQSTANSGRGDLTLSKFIEFAKSYKGDPRVEVMKLLELGKMSQSEFEYLKKQVQHFGNLIK